MITCYWLEFLNFVITSYMFKSLSNSFRMKYVNKITRSKYCIVYQIVGVNYIFNFRHNGTWIKMRISFYDIISKVDVDLHLHCGCEHGSGNRIILQKNIHIIVESGYRFMFLKVKVNLFLRRIMQT